MQCAHQISRINESAQYLLEHSASLSLGLCAIYVRARCLRACVCLYALAHHRTAPSGSGSVCYMLCDPDSCTNALLARSRTIARPQDLASAAAAAARSGKRVCPVIRSWPANRSDVRESLRFCVRMCVRVGLCLLRACVRARVSDRSSVQSVVRSRQSISVLCKRTLIHTPRHTQIRLGFLGRARSLMRAFIVVVVVVLFVVSALVLERACAYARSVPCVRR